MRIASFNVESLFERPVAMGPKTKAQAGNSGALSEWKPGASVLDAFARLNDLLAKDSYTDADKAATWEPAADRIAIDSATGNGPPVS